ncbi:MAG: hypothetical protein RR550_00150 [Rikenellaceae bacterium]
MTAEQFDRRQWSIRDKIVYGDFVYELKGVDFSRGMVTISDGIHNSFAVLYERIKIYNKK